MNIFKAIGVMTDSLVSVVTTTSEGLVSYAEAFKKTGDMVNVTLDEMIEEQKLEIDQIKSKRAELTQ